MFLQQDNKPLFERLIEYETEIRPADHTQLLASGTRRLDDPQWPVQWMVLDPSTSKLEPIEKFMSTKGPEANYEKPSMPTQAEAGSSNEAEKQQKQSPDIELGRADQVGEETKLDSTKTVSIVIYTTLDGDNEKALSLNIKSEQPSNVDPDRFEKAEPNLNDANQIQKALSTIFAAHDVSETSEYELVDMYTKQILLLRSTDDLIQLNGKHVLLVRLNWGHQSNQNQVHGLCRSSIINSLQDHLSQRRYACFQSKCRKTFDDVRSLLLHQRLHLDSQKKYVCEHPDCGKAFITAQRLRIHKEIHRNERKFKCPYSGCVMSYSKVQRLNIHIKKHIGQRDFHCPYPGCRQSFFEKGNLKTHYRLHTGERPYKCYFEFCNQTFTNQSHLNIHLKKHKRIAEI